MGDDVVLCESCGWFNLEPDGRYCNGCGKERAQPAVHPSTPREAVFLAMLTALALVFGAVIVASGAA